MDHVDAFLDRRPCFREDVPIELVTHDNHNHPIDPISQSRDLALAIADVIADTPAIDTQVMDIHGLTFIADYFVICSGENERQLRAISRSIVDEMADRKIRPRVVEGDPESGWILLDFADVIVHVFDAELRAFYRLEERWADAPVVLSIQ
ncbi:MAG: ribosome silencing factor [Thermomicrobiales bacterium]